jgi:hypothetical protein
VLGLGLNVVAVAVVSCCTSDADAATICLGVLTGMGTSAAKDLMSSGKGGTTSCLAVTRGQS